MGSFGRRGWIDCFLSCRIERCKRILKKLGDAGYVVPYSMIEERTKNCAPSLPIISDCLIAGDRFAFDYPGTGNLARLSRLLRSLPRQHDALVGICVSIYLSSEPLQLLSPPRSDRFHPLSSRRRSGRASLVLLGSHEGVRRRCSYGYRRIGVFSAERQQGLRNDHLL